jgi:bla regulator protein blaR1
MRLVFFLTLCSFLSITGCNPVSEGKPFVDDPEALGTWTSIDFVNNIEDFSPIAVSWKGEPLTKSIVIKPNGQTDKSWLTWSKGYIFHSGDKTHAQYFIKNIEHKSYLINEHMSGDVTLKGMPPKYFVYQKL